MQLLPKAVVDPGPRPSGRTSRPPRPRWPWSKSAVANPAGLVQAAPGAVAPGQVVVRRAEGDQVVGAAVQVGRGHRGGRPGMDWVQVLLLTLIRARPCLAGRNRRRRRPGRPCPGRRRPGLGVAVLSRCQEELLVQTRYRGRRRRRPDPAGRRRPCRRRSSPRATAVLGPGAIVEARPKSQRGPKSTTVSASGPRSSRAVRTFSAVAPCSSPRPCCCGRSRGRGRRRSRRPAGRRPDDRRPCVGEVLQAPPGTVALAGQGQGLEVGDDLVLRAQSIRTRA